MKAVSVLMPTYNVDKYVEIAVNSVLSQSSCSVRLLIADDNSTDDTFNILTRIATTDSRVTIRRPFSRRVGPVVLRQWLYDQSDSEWVFNQDADDVSLPRRFEKQLALIHEHPRADAIGGVVMNLTASGEEFLYPWERDFVNPLARGETDFRGAVRRQHCIVFGSIAVRRELVVTNLRLDVEAFPLADWDMFLRLAEFGCMNFVRDPIYRRRIHSEQISKLSVERGDSISYIVNKHKLESYSLVSYRNQGHVPGYPNI